MTWLKLILSFYPANLAHHCFITPNTLVRTLAGRSYPKNLRITVNTSLFTINLREIQILKTQLLITAISISETQQANVSLFSFSTSVFLLSHLHTTPPHTWPEMDGDRTVAR